MHQKTLFQVKILFFSEEGLSPSHTPSPLGAVLSPHILFFAPHQAFWICLSYTYKPVSLDFGFENLLLHYCVSKVGGYCMTAPA